MTDLEMVKKCAEKMGMSVHIWETVIPDLAIGTTALWVKRPDESGVHYSPHVYDPLDNDEQAIEMIKKFHLELSEDAEDGWTVTAWDASGNHILSQAYNYDLNRCIVRCVARLP